MATEAEREITAAPSKSFREWLTRMTASHDKANGAAEELAMARGGETDRSRAALSGSDSVPIELSYEAALTRHGRYSSQSRQVAELSPLAVAMADPESPAESQRELATAAESGEDDSFAMTAEMDALEDSESGVEGWLPAWSPASSSAEPAGRMAAPVEEMDGSFNGAMRVPESRVVVSVAGTDAATELAQTAHAAYPPLPLKCRTISVRLTPEEAELLRDRAAESGMTISAYLRLCVLEADELRTQVKRALAEVRQLSTTAHRGNEASITKSAESGSESVAEAKRTTPAARARVGGEEALFASRTMPEQAVLRHEPMPTLWQAVQRAIGLLLGLETRHSAALHP